MPSFRRLALSLLTWLCLLQDAIGGKVSSYIHHMGTFFIGLIIGFVRVQSLPLFRLPRFLWADSHAACRPVVSCAQGWQMALVILACTPLVALGGGIMVRRFGPTCLVV